MERILHKWTTCRQWDPKLLFWVLYDDLRCYLLFYNVISNENDTRQTWLQHIGMNPQWKSASDIIIDHDWSLTEIMIPGKHDFQHIWMNPQWKSASDIMIDHDWSLTEIMIPGKHDFQHIWMHSQWKSDSDIIINHDWSLTEISKIAKCG